MGLSRNRISSVNRALDMVVVGRHLTRRTWLLIANGGQESGTAEYDYECIA